MEHDITLKMFPPKVSELLLYSDQSEESAGKYSLTRDTFQTIIQYQQQQQLGPNYFAKSRRSIFCSNLPSTIDAIASQIV